MASGDRSWGRLDGEWDRKQCFHLISVKGLLPEWCVQCPGDLRGVTTSV